MKKIIMYSLIALVSFSLIGCGEKTKENPTPAPNPTPTPTPSETDSQKFKKEYEAVNPATGETGITLTLPEESPIEYKTIQEIFDILKNKTGIVYFGFPTCPWCRNIIPVLMETAHENNLPVYYYNVQNFRTTGDSNYDYLKEILKDHLTSDEDGQVVLYVPDVYFVKDGKIVGHQLGSVTGQINPYIALTEEQKTELKGIYQKLIDQIK